MADLDNEQTKVEAALDLVEHRVRLLAAAVMDLRLALTAEGRSVRQVRREAPRMASTRGH